MRRSRRRSRGIYDAEIHEESGSREWMSGPEDVDEAALMPANKVSAIQRSAASRALLPRRYGHAYAIRYGRRCLFMLRRGAEVVRAEERQEMEKTKRRRAVER